MMEGLLFLLVGPSGSGKTAIVVSVLNETPSLQRYVTYTTRSPRPGEVNGRDYNFVDRTEFERLLANGELIEWEELYGHLFGSSRDQIVSFIAGGEDGIAAYDIFGSKELSILYPQNVVTIFVVPPSIDEIRRRIIERSGADDNEIRLRLDRFSTEMQHVGEFDYVVENVNLQEAVIDVRSIIRAEHCKRRAREYQKLSSGGANILPG